MQVRVLFVGDGSHLNPVRAPFPTSSFIAIDPVDGHIIVDVPDEDLPPQLLEDEKLQASDTVYGRIIHGASKEAHEHLHRHLDERYQEHHGEYRPQLA